MFTLLNGRNHDNLTFEQKKKFQLGSEIVATLARFRGSENYVLHSLISESHFKANFVASNTAQGEK